MIPRSMALILALVLALAFNCCASPKKHHLAGVAFAAETAAPAKSTTPAKAEPQKPAAVKTFKGKVVSIDALANILVVKGQKGEETFQVDPAAKIVIKKKEAKLADIKKDLKVSVTYKEEGGKKVAVKIK